MSQFFFQKHNFCIYMIHEALGLHFASISLILPTPEYCRNYSTPVRGLKLSLLIARYRHFIFCYFSLFVSCKTRRLTLGKESGHETKKALKRGISEGLSCDKVFSGLCDCSLSFSTPFSIISGFMAMVQRLEMARNLTSR